LIWVLF